MKIYHIKNRTSIFSPVLVLLFLQLFPNLFADTVSRFKLPEYESFALENGLTIYLMEQHEVPLIALNAVFPAGSVLDEDNSGLAFLTAEALLFGTKSYTKKEIEKQLDFIGAEYGTGAAKEFAEIAISFLRSDIETVLPIVKEIITCPVFDEAELDKRKLRMIMELDMVKERPSQVINSYFNKFLFDDHPYGNSITGQKSTVAKITADLVREFYQKHYHPADGVVAVVGDFDTNEMKMKITALFEDWQVRDNLPNTTNNKQNLSVPDKNRILVVNKEDATETRFLVGTLGPKRNNPDFIPIQVVNTILGGRFTSWLNDVLRVNAGLTYGAGSYFNFYKNGGSFVVASYTPTPTTTKAIDMALNVLDRLHDEGIDEKTLLSAKNYIKGQYPPRYERSGSLATLLTEMFIYGFDESFINTFQQNVDGMTIEKTREIVEKYFNRDNLQFVLIGKASEIRDQVSKYGELIEKEIKQDGY